MEMEANEERSFFKKIKRNNINQRYLLVPVDFSKENPGCFQNERITLQKHPGSTPWHVGCIHRPDNGGVQLSSGWIEFVTGNNVEQGDVVVFRLVQGSIFTFDVYDPDGLEKPQQSLNVALPNPVPLNVKREALSDSDYADSEYEEHAESEASLSAARPAYPRLKIFKVPLTMLYILYVPVPYQVHFPPEKASVVFEDPWNREWVVKWNPDVRQLTKGLVVFLRANNIRVGDSVIFEPLRVGRFRVRRFPDN